MSKVHWTVYPYNYKKQVFLMCYVDNIYKNIIKVQYQCLACEIEILKKEFKQEVVFEIKSTKQNPR